MKRRIALTLVVAVLAFALVPDSTPAEDRALLIGIDRYRDALVPGTPGAVRDARELAALVRERFGFPEASIRLLLDEQATAAGIVQTFESWLIDGTSPGDRVFFLYAGHGSQLPDPDGDEEDGFDETLAPYDVDPLSGDRQIRDDILDRLVARLASRRAVLLFDSCHSGTVTRSAAGTANGPPDGAGVRYLPRPDQLRRLLDGAGTRGEPGSLAYSVAATRGGGAGGPVDRPSSLGRLAGIAVISAAQPGQLAYPVEVEGQPRGALSYLFQEVYSPAPGSRGLLKDLLGTVLQTASKGVDAAKTAAAEGEDLDLEERAESLAETLSLDLLGQLLKAGTSRLQGTGALEGEQSPEVDIVSEVPLGGHPLFGSWEQEPAVALVNPVGAPVVALRTAAGRESFEAGEELVFEVDTDRAGYLYLLVFSEQRVATCIFPNREHPDNRVEPGTHRLPGVGHAYSFPVQEPFGRDVVVALLSGRPRDVCGRERYTWDEVLGRLDLPAAHRLFEEQAARGIGVASSAEAAAAQDWQTSDLVLRTHPRAPR